ncbi:MAG: GxxExxY protein [Chloroflexi bacterium]|nr:GxxExxY protein [Chloroflexota bacterium]MCL5273311.1 GxxExxY protein [Chloroflexota bacterium]
MADLLYKEEVYAIVGAAMAVYNELGPGFLEAVYQEALEIELAERTIPYSALQNIPIVYKGRRLKKYYVADLVVFEKIIVELKALDRLTGLEEAQLINYLKATGFEVGLLINFGAQNKLEYKRMVLTPERNPRMYTNR